jgi:molybdate transport system substrate-binding protein
MPPTVFLRLGRYVLFAALTFLPVIAVAQDLSIAAAADLQFAMQDITARFQQQTGKKVQVVYGSSGNFAQQLRSGAPFDAFFSANLDYPRGLEKEGLIEPGSFSLYARGKIVLWVPNGSSLDPRAGLSGLLQPAVKKIAIANPEHAPYGKAAVAAMQSEHVYERVKEKLVLGENISQAASFVTSGAADAGILALALALSPNMKDKGRYAEVPASDYPPIEQACVILRSSKNKEVARQFLLFVQSKPIQELLRQYGFEAPPEKSAR